MDIFIDDLDSFIANDGFTQLKETNKIEILKIIQRANYPSDHPFLEEAFKNDLILESFAFCASFLKDDEIINDMINRKLIANEQGKFSYQKYLQAISELMFLIYLIWGLIKNNNFETIKKIDYEARVENKSNKKFEYSFPSPIDNTKKINIEVKTVTCDPYVKENDFEFKVNGKYIKSFFDNDISKYVSNSSEYILLKKSSQYKQVRSALKRIGEKFSCRNDCINLGIIVTPFATSLEEFYSFFFNPKKGYLFKNPSIFKNFDAVIFFSLTPTPDITLDDIYKMEHVFTAVTSPKDILEDLRTLRLDNIVFYDNATREDVKELAKREFGNYVLYDYKGIINFIPEDTCPEKIESYFSEIYNNMFK